MSVDKIPVFDRTAPRVPGSSGNGTSVQDLSQNFLRLLTVQLQNQDPMNPLDNAGMTTQLAALNQVDGINRLNKSMEAMVAQMQAAQFVQLSDSVGKNAQIEGNGVYYSGQPVILGAGLDKPASSLSALIRDNGGRVIREFEFDGTAPGIFDFIWDGRDLDGAQVAPGAYRLELQAKDGQGKIMMPTPYVSASVATIGRDGSDIVATMSDGRRISINDIVKWLAI
jgi:flagellar basal-body rod modification protein FlgD